MMKNRILTAASTAMMAVPWTILLLRRNAWALASPTAEIMIGCYIAFMLFSGIFTALCYTKGKVKNKLMQVCTAVNGLYAVCAVVLGGWAAASAML